MASTTTAGTSPFVAHDRAFDEVAGRDARLVRVVDVDAHEGPVYLADEDALYVTSLPAPSDIPSPGYRAVAIRRIQLDGERLKLDRDAVSTPVERTNTANGMTLGPDGRLIVCEQGSPSEHAAISAIDPDDGARQVIVDHWGGLRFNSPNDVVVAPDGAIWFTDPAYGHLQGFRPAPQLGDHVYRHDPATGATTVVADDFDKPNGLALSPDAEVLYVTDSGANQEPGSYHPSRPHRIVAYDVTGGRHLTGRRLVAVVTPGFPDGLAVDRDGRVYASAFDGVHVYSPDGDELGRIHLPGAVNFTFGGPDRNVLLITADTAVWAAVLNAQGA
jgi:gluconolactonase